MLEELSLPVQASADPSVACSQVLVSFARTGISMKYGWEDPICALGRICDEGFVLLRNC